MVTITAPVLLVDNESAVTYTTLPIFLPSTETTKPLSAAQGKALKDAIGDVPSGRTLQGEIGVLVGNIGYAAPWIQMKRSIGAKTATFPVSNTNWQCGIIIANISGYGNVIFAFNFAGSNTATLSQILGNADSITSVTFSNGVMTVTSTYTLNNVTVIGN